MRKYQPIWDRIKNIPEHTASIAADPALHARITKAVIKEKDMDKGWAYLQLEQEVSKKYKLECSSEGKVLTFTLVDCTPIIYRL
tara:strand:- start:1 stop:252 length:252 start_codon:yes stop_codon:yes gene_type:complete